MGILSVVPSRVIHTVEPAALLAMVLVFALLTILDILLVRGPASDVFRFYKWRDLMFARFWSYFGPMSGESDGPTIKPLLAQAYGKVVELGPGSGENVKHFNPAKVDAVFGVEPNASMHTPLRYHAHDAGLEGKYHIVGMPAESATRGSLQQLHGLGPNSVDTVAVIKVLCSVDQPEAVVGEMFRLLKPGGQILVYEHVVAKNDWFAGFTQQVYMFLGWKTLLAGCCLDRDTENMLRRIAGKMGGSWQKVELAPPPGQDTDTVIPKIMGRLVKA